MVLLVCSIVWSALAEIAKAQSEFGKLAPDGSLEIHRPHNKHGSRQSITVRGTRRMMRTAVPHLENNILQYLEGGVPVRELDGIADLRLGPWCENETCLSHSSPTYGTWPNKMVEWGAKVKQGNFGEIYFATFGDADVAIKLPRSAKNTATNADIVSEETLGFSARKEGWMYEKLKGPHVPKLFFAGDIPEGEEHGGDNALVLQRLEEDLEAYITRISLKRADGYLHALTFNETRSIVYDILQVLRRMHRAQPMGIMHRDLKLRNIMKDSAGNNYLIDFGFAVPVDPRKAIYPGANGFGHVSRRQMRGQELGYRDDLESVVYVALGLLLKKPWEASEEELSQMAHNHTSRESKAGREAIQQVLDGKDKFWSDPEDFLPREPRTVWLLDYIATIDPLLNEDVDPTTRPTESFYEQLLYITDPGRYSIAD